MDSRIVHRCLATYLRIDPERIDEGKHLYDDLGLDALDLVIVTLALERLHPDDGEFPFAELERPSTVGELIAVYDAFWGRPSLIESIPPTLRAAS
jgi:acyl carrier protein